jgi:hypothetical protein
MPGQRFCHSLPLPDGGALKYVSSIVLPSVLANPYGRLPDDLPLQAGLRGWSCTPLTGWSIDGTKRFLLRRTTSPEVMLLLWANSLKRWAYVNKERLLHEAENDEMRILSLEHLMECPHLPLEIENAEDFRERYLSEIRFAGFWKGQTAQIPLLNALVMKWMNERGA